MTGIEIIIKLPFRKSPLHYMKNYLFLLLVLFLNSCSKNPPAIPNPANAPDVSAVPADFEQKIVIENFTQTTCGQCPKASLILDSLIRFNPDRVYGASIHISDVLADTLSNSIFTGQNYYDSLFNSSGIYPSGMVNRVGTSVSDFSPDQWASKVFTSMGRTPSCGIAIEAKDIHDNKLSLTVHVGFSAALAGDYRIHTYLMEDNVYSNNPSYDQLNDFSINGSTPDTLLSLYNLDDTIHLYHHNNVFRRVVSPGGFTGTPIPQSAMVSGNDYVINFEVDISGINLEYGSILVFVDKYALSPYGHWIENVQSVPLGESKDWN